MVKFHINPKTLEPGKCSAKKQCPFGGDDAHFTSLEAAKNQSERLLGELNGWSSKKKASPNSAAVKNLVREIGELENNPARTQYGFPEDEMIRHNIETKIAEKRKELRALHPHGDFIEIRTSLRNEDIAYGVKRTAIEVSNRDKKYSWENVMGNSRRTVNNITKYENAVQAVVRNDPAYKESVEKYAKNSRDSEVFARAFENRLEIPKEYENAFEERWSSDRGEAYFNKELERVQQLKKDYAEGKISATKLVGSGLRNPKQEADKWLASQEVYFKRAIRTRGRSESVNVSNVMMEARKNGWEFSDGQK